LAAGVLYKRDEYFYNADPMGLDLIGFSATDDIEGSDHNVDAYVEALVPLLQDAPAAKQLNAVLGYRHSDYESAGGVDSYKAELLYQPVAPVRLRGSWQHAVRAASVFELFLPQLFTEYNADPNFGLVDPCVADSPERNGDAATLVEALCLAQGVPAALLPDFFDQDGTSTGVVGGNPDLDPETADTLAVGVVLQPGAERPLLSALQVSIDWYRIDVDRSDLRHGRQ
jgi:outer membrane receptor protein involved in Fe transport